MVVTTLEAFLGRHDSKWAYWAIVGTKMGF